MANYKRKKPKEYTHGDKWDYWKDSGNSRYRISVRDIRQPQMAHDEKHDPWRYRNVIEI